MQDITAEQALRTVCDMAFKGNLLGLSDILTLFDDITSEAYVDLLHIVTELGELPPAENYEIEDEERIGEDYRYHMRFHSPVRDVEANVTMRKVDGIWMLAAFKVPGIRE